MSQTLAKAQFTLMKEKQVKEVSKALLRNIINIYQNKSLNIVGTALTGSPIEYQQIPVHSPLASASLFCSFLRHKVIRKDELPGTSAKKILQLLSPGNRIWRTAENAAPKRQLVLEQVRHLQHRITLLEQKANFLRNSRHAGRLSSFLSSSGRLYKEQKLPGALQYAIEKSLLEAAPIDKINEEIKAIKSKIYSLLSMSMAADVKELQFGNLHPSQSTSLLTSDVATNISLGSTRTILGMSLRIAGPRKGNRAMVWRENIGAYSIIGPVVSETASIQLPSRIGVFGLKVTIAYMKQERLANDSMTLLPMTTIPFKRGKDIEDRHRQLKVNRKGESGLRVFGFSETDDYSLNRHVEDEELTKLLLSSISESVPTSTIESHKD